MLVEMKEKKSRLIRQTSNTIRKMIRSCLKEEKASHVKDCHTCVHVYMCMSLLVCSVCLTVHTCVHACACITRTCISVWTHTHVSMYVCACMCIFHAHVYLCGYTHTCLCMCVYLHMCAFIRVHLRVCVALLTEKCVRAEALRQEDVVGCKGPVCWAGSEGTNGRGGLEAGL